MDCQSMMRPLPKMTKASLRSIFAHEREVTVDAFGVPEWVPHSMISFDPKSGEEEHRIGKVFDSMKCYRWHDANMRNPSACMTA